MIDDKNTISVSDKYRAVDELINESRPNKDYYSLLVLSSIIIAAGILLANSAILIGGMLVTPLLNPILLVALGVAASRPEALKRSGMTILKSSGVVIGIAFVAGFIFSVPENGDFYRSSLFDNSVTSAFLYFLVAFSSGIAATFAWIRKGVTNILPGISIAVSLVPPLAMIGIWLATGNLDLMRYFLIVFLFNMVGIIGGSMIIFSMLGFYKTSRHIEKRMEEEIQLEEENNTEEIKESLGSVNIEEVNQKENA